MITAKTIRRTKCDDINTLRRWADHLGLRLRRRGSGHSIYDGAVCRVDFRKAGRRIDFQNQSQIARWLDNYMYAEIERLRPRRRGRQDEAA
jgi:hypothetical protein